MPENTKHDGIIIERRQGMKRSDHKTQLEMAKPAKDKTKKDKTRPGTTRKDMTL